MCLGIPGEVVAKTTTNGLAMGTVDFGGIRKEVCLAYVPEIALGEYVIVHVGFAISRIDQAEAHRTLAVLRAMADLVEGELGQPLPAAGAAP
jgi:hydrogenase expression/formation protein HypC